MKFSYRSVPLKEILFEDHTFCLSYPCRALNLISSIDLVGIINPPVIREGNEGFQIVCGRGRLEAARKLGYPETTCKILPAWIDDLSCLSISFEENITTRGFNLVEKALVVEKFLDHLSEKEVIKQILPRLGLAPGYHHFEMLRRIAFLEEEAKKLLVSGELNPQIAVKLLEIDENSRRLFLKLVKELRLSHSRQREIFELLQDLSRKKDLSWEEILQEKEIKEVLEGERLPAPQKAEKLHRILKKKLYPRFSAAWERIEKISHRLAQEGARLKVPQALEKDLWQLEISFRNREELKEKWHKVLATLSRLEF